MTNIFQENAPDYWEKGFSVVPLQGKVPLLKGWQHYINGPPKLETRLEWLGKYKEANIGLLTGTPISPEFNLAVVDCDDDKLVRLLSVVLGPGRCSKLGKKGRSDFFKISKNSKIKSTQLKDVGGVGKIDILAGKKQTVLPPSIHPELQMPYVWLGSPLLECDPLDFPELTDSALNQLRLIVGSKHLPTLLSGTTTHDATVGLVAQLVMAGVERGKIPFIIAALLPEDYAGDSIKQVGELIESAKTKFSKARENRDYEPGEVGPIPLGRDGDEFHFRCQQTNRLASRTARALSTAADILSLAPSDFWIEQFPKLNSKGVPIGIDSLAACDALIQSCTRKGVIEASDIRGFGMWEEEGLLVRNTGQSSPESDRYIYSYPSRRQAPIVKEVDVGLVLEFFQQANWSFKSSAELLLGWCFSSVICGALSWRPHLAITGAAASGKTTQLRGVGEILRPVAIILEGISSEAGIRQNIGYDARPCILDELESESSSDIGRINRIVKLMRSASSANGSVARGTQDGKAHNFCTRASFLVGSINPRRIGAADTSRNVRLEMRPPVAARDGRKAVLELLEALKGTGPSFCELSMSLAKETLASIPLLHASMPAIQERQADNLATLLAGFWVAINRRTITASEADDLVELHRATIEQQQENSDENDAIECLNILLAYGLGDQSRTAAGAAILSTLAGASEGNELWVDHLARIGVRIESRGCLVATSHPGLREVYRGSRWEGGMWGSALERLPGAKAVAQRRFSEGVRSRAIWIPAAELPNTGDSSAFKTPSKY